MFGINYLIKFTKLNCLTWQKILQEEARGGVFISLLCCSLIFSQEKTIFGNATNSDAVSLPVESIVATKPNLCVATDFDVNFGIPVTKRQTLLINYMGFETREIIVYIDYSHSIILDLGNVLSEAVITSHGVSRPKRELTFKTQNINTKRTYGTRPDANHGNTFYSKI